MTTFEISKTTSGNIYKVDGKIVEMNEYFRILNSAEVEEKKSLFEPEEVCEIEEIIEKVLKKRVARDVLIGGK